MVRGGNAHGKLMRKWGAIERYVAMMTSRWAPVQEPGEWGFSLTPFGYRSGFEEDADGRCRAGCRGWVCVGGGAGGGV